MTREELNQFLLERPQISLSGLSKELKRGRNYLVQQLPLSGELGVYGDMLLPIMVKYGYLAETPNAAPATKPTAKPCFSPRQ